MRHPRSSTKSEEAARAWMAPADRLLAEAMRSIRLLGAVTPVDAAKERARLITAFERGEPASPRWTYATVEHGDVRRALEVLATGIERGGGPLAAIYAARARELAEEALLAESAGHAPFAALARQRFAAAEHGEEASRLARAWLHEPEGPRAPSPRTLVSDGPGPDSLLGRMNEAVGRLRLPFTVTAAPHLASLAATGDRTILVATGRAVSSEDIARTVLHEIEGHVRPRARASMLSPRIFQIGTARGADEQEGLALVLEERHGFLAPARRRELAARHVAVETMLAGATFCDCVRALVRDHALPPRDAVLVAERSYRGGDGERAGLGRELVYIASFVRVKRALAVTPSDEHVLTAGQVALAAVAVLRPHAGQPIP